jgi:hypothetical protein
MAAPTPESQSKSKRPRRLPSTPCSRDLPFDAPTPHAAIEAVIAWLGIGYQSTITRRSDGKKITIKITSENDQVRRPAANGIADTTN